MEEENIENIDLPNDETEIEIDVENEEEAPQYTKREQALYEQLKKAKGFVRGEDGKWVKKEVKTEEKPEEKKEGRKSDGLDYGQKAFLIANGIKGEAEMKFVQDAMKDSGKTLEQILDSKYFQSELEEMREITKTTEATPSGKRSGNVPTDNVEYWMTKPMEEVPKEMRIKVVNAKLKQSESKGVFYNS